MSTLATTAVARRERSAELSARFIDSLFETIGPRDFAVRLWNGEEIGPSSGSPARFTLLLGHPAALRAMFLPPGELSLGEAYIYRDFDIEGDLEAVFDVFDRMKALARDPARMARLGGLLMRLPAPEVGRSVRGAHLLGRRHSRRRDQDAIRFHYDVGNDFYRLWLDERMVYSCAYFEDPDMDLDSAQRAKLDHICRKLRLFPGDRLLDIGCGWGGLLVHAAENYGASVDGVTLSPSQAEHARSLVKGLHAKDCDVQLRDYRDVEGRYDKLVSVGMFEHLGAEKLPEYFRRAYELLEPGGVFLNHGISREYGRVSRSSRVFLNRYVFPDGDLLPISETLDAAEAAGFEVRDVESLREHYATTLRHWVARLKANADEARAATDDVTCRIWELYMSGSAHGFHTGQVNVYQTLLAKPTGGPSGLPPTRRDWYA